MNSIMTMITGVMQGLRRWSVKLSKSVKEKRNTPFGMRSSSNHQGWFYLVEKSEKLSIWRKGNTLISMVYPKPFLYFVMEHPEEGGRLTRMNQKNITNVFSSMNTDAMRSLKSGTRSLKYGKPFFSVLV